MLFLVFIALLAIAGSIAGVAFFMMQALEETKRHNAAIEATYSQPIPAVQAAPVAPTAPAAPAAQVEATTASA